VIFLKGYDTVPEDEGIELTCSERMRLAVARAIVRDPSILIIEEPETTDHVSISESYVLKCLVETGPPFTCS
jgi:ABC-type multidrug transport system fused ATPase/permease subunit